MIGPSLFPGMNYLFRLREQMQKPGFPNDGGRLLKVEAAYDTMATS
jgi:hypothetical protein